MKSLHRAINSLRTQIDNSNERELHTQLPNLVASEDNNKKKLIKTKGAQTPNATSSDNEINKIDVEWACRPKSEFDLCTDMYQISN